jgi:hypothetical protein
MNNYRDTFRHTCRSSCSGVKHVRFKGKLKTARHFPFDYSNITFNENLPDGSRVETCRQTRPYLHEFISYTMYTKSLCRSWNLNAIFPARGPNCYCDSKRHRYLNIIIHNKVCYSYMSKKSLCVHHTLREQLILYDYLLGSTSPWSERTWQKSSTVQCGNSR